MTEILHIVRYKIRLLKIYKKACPLLNFIDFQSLRGGFDTPEYPLKFHAGRYWSADSWSDFSQRIILGITLDPCRNSDAIREKIIRETNRKMEADELF